MLFKSFLPVVSPATWKVISFICRKTYGWIDGSTGRRKEWDALSVSQIVDGTGLSDTGVSEILNELVRSGLILRGQMTRNGYLYSVDVHCDEKAAIEVLRLKPRGACLTGNSHDSNHPTQLDSPTQLGANSVGGSSPTQSGSIPELSLQTKETIKTNPQKSGGAHAVTPSLTPDRKKKNQVEDPRFHEICDAILEVWPKTTRCDIDELDAKAISAYLKRKPDFTGEEIANCIVFRAMSEGVNLTLPVCKWIADVDKYQGGPLDKFGNQWSHGALNHLRDQARVTLNGEPAQRALAEAPRVHLPADMDYIAGEQAWQFVRTHLKNHLGQHAWDTWIRPLAAIGILRDILYVRTPNAAFGNIREKYATPIGQALAGLASDLVLISDENLAEYDFEGAPSRRSLHAEEATT